MLIRRDGYGILHIEAEGDEDAWYGLGFCQGQDRAFQSVIAPVAFLILFSLAAACGSEAAPDPRVDRLIDRVDQLFNDLDDLGREVRRLSKAMIDFPDQAPDFELVLFENALHKAGERLRLSDLKGNPVIINFWFPSCPPCRAEMPVLEKVFQSYRSDRVEFVGVQLLGLDSAQDGQDFIEEFGVSYAIGPDEDGSIVWAYEIRGFPSTIFIDRDLRIVRAWTGPLNEEKLEELLQEVLPLRAGRL